SRIRPQLLLHCQLHRRAYRASRQSTERLTWRHYCMPYSPEDKKRAITRLRRIKRHAAALDRAIEEGTDCNALLQQSAAQRGAANGLMAEVLDSHLHELFGSAKADVPAHKPVDPDEEIDAL